MAAKDDHKLLLRKLKKQVRALQKKEEAAKNQLRVALLKIRKLSRAYKVRLAARLRASKARITEAKSSYAKAAEEIERQLVKGIETRGKALASAISKIERKYATRLKRKMSKKSKTGKTRPAVKMKAKPGRSKNQVK